MKQTSMDLPFADVIASRPAGPPEPLFWFKTFRILRDFSPKPEAVVREIRFRAGLNIVWSKAPSGETDNAKERTAGHAAGKTTLCCLLRGLLGEPVYAPLTFRQAAAERCPDWWFAAEIRLNGSSWCVARAFGRKGIRAVKMQSLDEFLAANPPTQRDEFDRALSEAASLISPVKEMPGGEALAPWGFFPWFVRDQDAQFSSAVDWTAPSSGRAVQQNLTPQNRSLVVRSVFDPFAAEEVPLLEELDKAKKEATKRKRNTKAKLGNLQEVGAWAALNSAEKDLANDQGVLRLDRLRKQYENEFEELESDRKRVSEAESACWAAAAKWGSLYQQAEAAAKNQASFYEKNKDELSGLPPPGSPPPVDDEYLMRILRSMPSREFCCVPMSVARSHRCPVAQGENGNALIRQTSSTTLAPKSVYAENASMFRAIERELDAAQAEFDEARRVLDEEQAALDTRKIELGKKLDRLDFMENLEAKAAEESREAERLNDAVKNLKKMIDEARSLSHSATKTFHEYFGDTLRFVYGTSASGHLSMSKGVIRLDATIGDSTRNGAALNAATVVCFDLALLAEAADGKCTHPRFLVHDGPRVADLTGNIYHRYFEFAEMLAARSSTPNFQYIITTTTPPPERFLDSGSVVCTLDASTNAGRLLGVDLT